MLKKRPATRNEKIVNPGVYEVPVLDLEQELCEQARLVGMGGERELALMAKVDRLERENAALLAANRDSMNHCNEMRGDFERTRKLMKNALDVLDGWSANPEKTLAYEKCMKNAFIVIADLREALN